MSRFQLKLQTDTDTDTYIIEIIPIPIPIPIIGIGIGIGYIGIADYRSNPTVRHNCRPADLICVEVLRRPDVDGDDLGVLPMDNELQLHNSLAKPKSAEIGRAHV